MKLAAIFSKHIGFREEQEWRIVYTPERDPDGRWRIFLDYANGPRGLEPKFKVKIRPLEGVTAADLSLEKIVAQIILGPSRSSSLVECSAKRMLEQSRKTWIGAAP